MAKTLGSTVGEVRRGGGASVRNGRRGVGVRGGGI
jgi:hypothetical protein